MKLTKQQVVTYVCNVTGYTHPSMPGIIIHYGEIGCRTMQKGWILTHIESGLPCYKDALRDKQEALCFFEYLRATGINWTLRQFQLLTLYPDLERIIVKAFNRAKGGRPRQRTFA